EGRPVSYDIWISMNDSSNYNAMVQGITDTTWIWNHTGIEAGSPFYLKINGYSVDTTLKGYAYSGQPLFVHNELLSKQENHNKMTLYPVPASKFLNVRLGQTVNKADINIYNISGKHMLNIQSFSGNHLQLPLNTLDAGTYFLMIDNGRQIMTERFTVLR
ncbi:MAG TPA: hypothetical protein DCL86_07995, partial [Bacteroidales bacterium]|nr:hypothetical protein [Bacteroidales bacterium]